EVSGGINHLGIQVSSTEDVLAAKQRLQNAGLATFDEMDTTCCYAVQDKIWVTSPDGHRWEVFVVKGDAEVMRETPPKERMLAVPRRNAPNRHKPARVAEDQAV